MTKNEWLRLRAFIPTHNFPPRNVRGKRTERGRGKGVGLVTTKSYVKTQLPLLPVPKVYTINNQKVSTK